MHPRTDVTTLALAQQLHLLHWTDLTYLMDTCFMIHMLLLLFLVSPMCALLWSCSQALSIASLQMSLMLAFMPVQVFLDEFLPLSGLSNFSAPTYMQGCYKAKIGAKKEKRAYNAFVSSLCIFFCFG